MCLAIPVQVVEFLEEGMVRVRVGESQTFLTASTMLFPAPSKIGDFLIVHAGFALHVLTEEEAMSSLSALREIADTLNAEGTLDA